MEFDKIIVRGKELEACKRIRTSKVLSQRIPQELLTKRIAEGWEKELSYKNGDVKIYKQKPVDIAFEDRVWTLLANIGFTTLNKDRKFKIPYSKDEKLTKQIDIFASDDDVVLFVECKTSKSFNQTSNFKTEIEAIKGYKEGIINSVKTLINKNIKPIFIFATNGYLLSDIDKERLKDFDINHFPEETIEYYEELSRHLGFSARYQMLGALLEGKKVPNLDSVLPAIRGTMGGYTYYSFSIEPEKLLKISYVLHHSSANKEEMPAYQRLIKKARLKSVSDFINKGGFFPNSVIVNIVSKKELQFDLCDKNVQSSSSLCRLGVLHLPQKYKSVYIIDGQHRLYGYANSEYKNSNTIPVVAFVNLEKEKQIKIFMEINENQKAVSKNLRNTLEADLLWFSDNKEEQKSALASRIAQKLGEDKQSSLYDRVIIGENKKTETCCITLDMIKTAILKSSYLNTYKKNAIILDGVIDLGNIDATYNKMYPLIRDCLSFIREGIPQEWERGEGPGGYVCINVAIHSFIRILCDILVHLRQKKGINIKEINNNKLLEEIKYYLDPMIDFLANLSPEKGQELRKNYGAGAPQKFLGTLQTSVKEVRNDFNPEGLEKYIKDSSKKYNTDSYSMIMDIEKELNRDFKTKLMEKYLDKWQVNGLPKEVYLASNELATKKSYDEKRVVDLWDCLHLIDYRKIATYGDNWSSLFEKYYSWEKAEGRSKDAKTQWIEKLNTIRNKNSHNYSVTEEEYKFIKQIHSWLFKKTIID